MKRRHDNIAVISALALLFVAFVVPSSAALIASARDGQDDRDTDAIRDLQFAERRGIEPYSTEIFTFILFAAAVVVIPAILFSRLDPLQLIHVRHVRDPARHIRAPPARTWQH